MLTANNACGVSKTRAETVFAGTPIIGSRVTVDGQPNYYPNYINGSAIIAVNNGSNCETYKWDLFGGSGYFNTNGFCGGCGNVFNGITFDNCATGYASTSSSMAIRIRSANRCGQGTDAIVPLQNSGGGSGYYMMAGPNPATDAVTIIHSKNPNYENSSFYFPDFYNAFLLCYPNIYPNHAA